MSSDFFSTERHDHWTALSRGLEYEGEERANLLRIIAIGMFYTVQLIAYYGMIDAGDLSEAQTAEWRLFHFRITLLAVVWTMLALGLTIALRNRIFPPWLKYLSTTVDLVMLSSILLAASGPRSPAVVGYFVIIALSALRFRLRLIWCATAGAMAFYFALNVHFSRFSTRNLDISATQQWMFLIALGLEGVVLGQMVRKVKQASQLYALRRENDEKTGEDAA